MRSNLLLKLCTVASSLLLAAAFVSYRAGAFAWSSTPRDAPPDTLTEPWYVTVDGASPQRFVCPTDPTNPSGSAAAGEQIFYSSKSGAVFIPTETSSPGKTQLSPTGDVNVRMSGSKTLFPSPLSPGREMIMPGSKSPGGF